MILKSNMLWFHFTNSVAIHSTTVVNSKASLQSNFSVSSYSVPPMSPIPPSLQPENTTFMLVLFTTDVLPFVSSCPGDFISESEKHHKNDVSFSARVQLPCDRVHHGSQYSRVLQFAACCHLVGV